MALATFSPCPAISRCFRVPGERWQGARCPPGCPVWRGFPRCLRGLMLSPGATPAAPRFAGRARRAVSQGDKWGEQPKTAPRGCGEWAAAPLAERAALFLGGEGTTPCFPWHHGARPLPQSLQGSTQNPTSGTKAVRQGPRCSQLLPGETPPAAKALQTFHPVPSPSPGAMPPASRATCQAAGAPRARAGAWGV